MSSNLTTFDKNIPPLENGDRLTAFEFEDRYQLMSNVKKAELIEGLVYMPAALRFRQHGKPHAHIIGWLAQYEAATSGVELADNATVRLDEKNVPQPDALLRIDKGGKSIISEDDYVEGAPELIIEIAASTVSIDLHDKLKVYERHQVQEYLVWRVYDNQIDWFSLKEGQYTKLKIDKNGVIKSEVYRGLWLDVPALLTGNLLGVLEVLQQGMKTKEYEDFRKKLLT
ncbi:Uma2 family endonuclease [Cyanothece sp. BG0011]|uniref:Uma2 family endonuclease n=1 Tax=Cyanothece sp. BG0011 TaxID=2082950 RepID=UPI000D1EFFE9|nr:Uma2 family endonuclease [Cyanothece sp. BG0011]